MASLYGGFLTQEEKTIPNILGAILSQLVGRGDIPEHLHQAFREAKREFGSRGLHRGLHRARLPDLVRMLRLTIASIPQVFICIHALDGCLPKRLPEFLGPLGDIVRELPRTRIFLTGGPHIEEDIHRYFTGAVVAPISPDSDDIRSYLETGSDRGAKTDAMNDGSRPDTGVMPIVVERISDVRESV